MSNKKDKEKWKRIQEHKKKCCRYCSQLVSHYDGNYLCHFLKSKTETPCCRVIINAPDIDKHKACFDKYNGLNLK